MEQGTQQSSTKIVTEEIYNERTYKIKLLRWFFFGIFFSFLPVIISLAVSWYIGNQTEFSGVILGYFIDFVLVIFAVATNACSYATDGFVRIGWMILSIAGMVISGFIYIIYLAVPSEKVYAKLFPTFIGAAITLIVCSLVGFLIEHKDRKEKLQCQQAAIPTSQKSEQEMGEKEK